MLMLRLGELEVTRTPAPEPSEIAGVDQHGRRRLADDTIDEILTEQILVADERAHTLVCHRQR